MSGKLFSTHRRVLELPLKVGVFKAKVFKGSYKLQFLEGQGQKGEGVGKMEQQCTQSFIAMVLLYILPVPGSRSMGLIECGRATCDERGTFPLSLPDNAHHTSPGHIR